MRRGNKPMSPVSPKRRSLRPERDRTRDAVIERDGGCCGEGLPGVPHDHPVGRPWTLEVHELRRGAMRSTDFVNPDACIALCPAAHEFATTAGYPEPARRLGLVLHGWESLSEARPRRLANGGVR